LPERQCVIKVVGWDLPASQAAQAARPKLLKVALSLLLVTTLDALAALHLRFAEMGSWLPNAQCRDVVSEGLRRLAARCGLLEYLSVV
jgi:hypothetical protein